MPDFEHIRRKTVSDVPFSTEELSDEFLHELVGSPAFDNLDPEFRYSPAFKGVLRRHARLHECGPGAIIVRQGDWGNSAFFVVSGTAVAEWQGGVLREAFQEPASPKGGLFQTIARLWRNHRTPEFRGNQSYFTGAQSVAAVGAAESAQVYLQDVPGVMNRYEHKVLGAGELFGEIAALGRIARTATVFTNSPSQILEIRWQGLRELMRRGDFKQHIERRFRETALEPFLLSSPVFRHLRDNPEAIAELTAQTRLEVYGDYDRAETFKALVEEGDATGLKGEPLIAAEGDYADGIVMIRSGLARLSHKHFHGHRTVSYVCPGQIYALPEIAEGWQAGQAVPLRYSLRAIGFLTAVVIPTGMVEKYVLEPSATGVAGVARRLRRNVPGEPKRIDQDFVEFLVQDRIVNGTATMLIDLDRCTRCDDCVRACASTHDNNPRFLRHGPIHDHFMVANACMHCQDPLCMIECPTGAISRRTQDGVIAINDDTCIGCGACARNCEYDAIRMVEIRDTGGFFIRDRQSPDRAPITKATKCDLCADQWGGPACQRACPHDALVRIDMSDVQWLADWCNR